jgi:CRISPR/Cas system-associated exonuclease Cas4 (RecB family)
MAFITGSRLNRAMECTGSVIISRISEETEAGNAGRWKHAFIEKLRAGMPLEQAAAEVPAEYREACESLDAAALNGLEMLESELRLAYNVRSRVAQRDVEPDATGFDDVFARTDLGGVIDGVACVIDVKTGRYDVESARNNWQLLAAALALAQLHQLSAARVAILYLRDGQRARWDIADLDGLDLETAAMQLEQLADKVSWIRKKGEQPPVRMGEWCKFCPRSSTVRRIPV